MSRGLWWTLLRACMALSMIGFGGVWSLGRLRGALGAELDVGSPAVFYLLGGLGACGAAALLSFGRLRGRGPAIKVMACGGTLSAAAFQPGSNYGVCSARCTHSRQDFERR